MKLSRILSLVTFGLSAACSSEPTEQVASTRQALLGDGLVISQVYGGGGSGSSAIRQDYVELHNTTNAAIDLAGLSLQYGGSSATSTYGSSSGQIFALPTATIPAGGYYLIGLASGTTGATLSPTPDATGSIGMGGTDGKIALARQTASIACGSSTVPCTSALVVDMVAYGSAVGGEGASAGALSVTTAALRNDDGCADTNVNSADFTVGAPAPRNSMTTAFICGADAGAVDAAVDTSVTDLGVDTDVVDTGSDVVEVVDTGAEDAEPTDAGSAPDTEPTDSGAADTEIADADRDAVFDAIPEDTSTTDSSTGDTSTGPLGTGLVISQIYGGGGNSMATLNQDYVEIFNRTDAPISLDGLSIQYGSATGNFANPMSDGGPGSGITVLPNVSVPGKSYYLVAMGTAGTTGSALPTADFTGPSNLSGTSGKVALARTTMSLACGASSRCPTANIVDMIGYGGANDYEGTGPSPALNNTTAAFRLGNGCVDTDNNAVDVTTGAPAPRNLASGPGSCTVVVPDGGTDSAVTDTATTDTATTDTATSDTGTVEDTGSIEDTSTTPSDTGSLFPDTGSADTGSGVAPPVAVEDEGCSCRTAGGGDTKTSSAAFAALALLGAVVARRRRQ